MPQLKLLIGLPGSGKTTYARQLSETDSQWIHLSSDKIAYSTFRPDEPILHQQVFEELFQQTASALKAGMNVIYDATNLSSRRRRSLLNRLNSIQPLSEAVVFLTPYDVLKDRNRKRTGRDRVPDEIIERYTRGFELPRKDEKFEKLTFFPVPASTGLPKGHVHQLISKLEHNSLSYADVGEFYNSFKETKPIVAFERERPEQLYPVSRQMYEVLLEIQKEPLHPADKKLMLLVALLLDIGKPYTRKDGVLKQNYYGHEHVSAYLAYSVLAALRFSETFIYDALLLIDEHVTAKEAKRGKLRRRIGQLNVERMQVLLDKLPPEET